MIESAMAVNLCISVQVLIIYVHMFRYACFLTHETPTHLYPYTLSHHFIALASGVSAVGEYLPQFREVE